MHGIFQTKEQNHTLRYILSTIEQPLSKPHHSVPDSEQKRTMVLNGFLGLIKRKPIQKWLWMVGG